MPELILTASGSEVGLIVAAAERLQGQGVAVRCVSMPSWELFDPLPQAERDAVLPPSVSARLAVEAGMAQGWHRYVGAGDDVLSVERFGASAPTAQLQRTANTRYHRQRAHGRAAFGSGQLRWRSGTRPWPWLSSFLR